MSKSNDTVAPRKTRVERILEPFGARHAAGLIAFFEKVAESDVDMVIFMARKSLCIYRMMEICGIKKIPTLVLSDALLDSDANFFRNKRILVVDDTLFVGTTLYDAKKRLRVCKPASLVFWVYCVDGGTWSKDTFEPDYIHDTLTSQEIIEFCAAECRALINAAIPYLTDFAASKRIRMTPAQLDRAIKPVNWIFHDVSSQYHEKSKVKYYSAFPDHFTNEIVRNTIGDSIFELIEISKIRTFATWTGRAYDVTFVPVITFSPTNRANLRRAVRSLCEAFGIEQSTFNPSNVMEKMRFLQYLIGAIYLQTYWEAVEKILTIAPDSKYSYEWSASVFSKHQSDALSVVIAKLYSSDDRVHKAPQHRYSLVRPEPISIRNETKDDLSNFLEEYFSGDNETDFGHTPLSDLTAIFLEFQSRFEVAARLEIINKDSNPKYRDRLKRGIAWRSLCSYLLKKYGSKNNIYNRNMLSLVLDRLIDFGIAVPIIALSDDLVYRAYRHGEDVKFGAQEESLIFNLLAGFQAARGSEGIEATYIEKLIVILLRVGMNEDWLNLWYSYSGRDTLVRVGYHLQGAVPISPRREDELVPESESSWLSRRLLKNGTLRKIPNPKRPGFIYHLGNNPDAAHVRADAPRTATMLGNTLGRACTFGSHPRSASRPLSAEDLIVLTSCSNALDTTGAIAAELRIFGEWYENEGSRIFRAAYASNLKDSRPRIAVMGSRGAEAINSAGWKLEKYETSAIDGIRNKVFALQEHDTDWIIRKSLWEAIFEAFHRSPEESEGRRLVRIRETAQKLTVCLKFILNCLDSIAKLVLQPNDEDLYSNLTTLLHDVELPHVVPLPDFKMLANMDTEPCPSTTSIRSRLSYVAQSLDQYARSLCSLAAEEASVAEGLILKANQKLSRVQYSYMIWYDILDVRARKQGGPDATNAHVKAVKTFRDNINSMLSDAQDRIRASRGELFCDTGDIASFNDAKHIFLNAPSGAIEEGNRLICDIVRLAESSGVKLRLLAVPTNLRGEYVYLNRGAISVDGDFKSHVYTIIQNIEDHKAEASLGRGGCIIWLLSNMVHSFQNYGSICFDKNIVDNTEEIVVNIRGFIVENSLSFVKNILH